MSATLIAVLLALLLGHVIKPLRRWRRYEWFDAWLAFLRRQLPTLVTAGWGIVFSLGLPLLLLYLLQARLESWLFGLPGFLFALVVLIYCWGPRDLDQDVDAVCEARDAEARQSALAELITPGLLRPSADDEVSLVVNLFAQARRRWFGVLFWFLLLGPLGAMLYRLSARGTQHTAQQSLSEWQAAHYRRLLAILDWPVAYLMAAALALVSNFDAVAGAWRHWYQIRRGHPFDFSTGFLDAAALAATLRTQRETSLDAKDEEDGPREPAASVAGSTADPAIRPVMQAAMTLIWRSLTAWLAVIALFVLAGYA